MSGIVYRRSDGAAWRGVARVSATGALLSLAVSCTVGSRVSTGSRLDRASGGEL